MRIKHRYSFRVDDTTREIEEFLKKNKIKYKIGSGIPILTLEIFEDDKCWENIERLLNKHSKQSISECVYSNREFEDAKWFRMRSKWRSEYPQPEEASEYKKTTYDTMNYCTNCGCGLVQKDSFRLNKSPNWGSKKFLMLNLVESEIFVADEVANQLHCEDTKGFSFLPVINHKTNEPVENIKQLHIANTLETGMKVADVDIKKVNICSHCQSKKYLLTGRSPLVFSSKVFEEGYDIVKSSEVFGDGLVCLQMIFISKKLYDILSAHGWLKELSIEPVILAT